MIRPLKRSRLRIGAKKAQIETRVIVYVLAVFIAAMILLFGFRVVKNIVGTQQEILSVGFKEDFKSEVTKKSYEFRNVEVREFLLSSDYSQVCFGDLSQSDNLDMLSKMTSMGFVLIRDSVESQVRRNVFLLEGKKLKDGFYAGDIVVSDTSNYFECVDVINGEVKIRLEALGKEGVLVS